MDLVQRRFLAHFSYSVPCPSPDKIGKDPAAALQHIRQRISAIGRTAECPSHPHSQSHHLRLFPRSSLESRDHKCRYVFQSISNPGLVEPLILHKILSGNHEYTPSRSGCRSTPCLLAGGTSAYECCLSRALGGLDRTWWSE